MNVPDFLIWHCAGCGAAAKGTKKPCGCATNVGTRRGPNGRFESTWWDAPPDPRDGLIAAQSAALALAEGALKLLLEVLELFAVRSRPEWDGYVSQTRAIGKAREALAAVNAVKGTGEKR